MWWNPRLFIVAEVRARQPLFAVASCYCISFVFQTGKGSRKKSTNGSESDWGASGNPLLTVWPLTALTHSHLWINYLKRHIIGAWGNASGASRWDLLTLVSLMFSLSAEIWIRATKFWDRQRNWTNHSPLLTGRLWKYYVGSGNGVICHCAGKTSCGHIKIESCKKVLMIWCGDKKETLVIIVAYTCQYYPPG